MILQPKRRCKALPTNVYKPTSYYSTISTKSCSDFNHQANSTLIMLFSNTCPHIAIHLIHYYFLQLLTMLLHYYTKTFFLMPISLCISKHSSICTINHNYNIVLNLFYISYIQHDYVQILHFSQHYDIIYYIIHNLCTMT